MTAAPSPTPVPTAHRVVCRACGRSFSSTTLNVRSSSYRYCGRCLRDRNRKADARRRSFRIKAPVNTDWMTEAACSGNLSLFFSNDRADQRAAMARCAACPVLDACAAWAKVVRPGYGVWAGKHYGV